MKEGDGVQDVMGRSGCILIINHRIGKAMVRWLNGSLSLIKLTYLRVIR